VPLHGIVPTTAPDRDPSRPPRTPLSSPR
jgi:hypothetical protein